MNLGLFNKLMKHRPSQHAPEWRIFLEICEMYMRKNGIVKPIVVELGIWKNRQKQFYEQLLGAQHIGINLTSKRSTPDILGNTHDPKTMEMLKEKLRGRPINILFIDASHHYEDIKKDFELYSPLCSDIIALHDIEDCRHIKKEEVGVWKFWDELKAEVYKGAEKYRGLLFLLIHQYRDEGNKAQMGIGMIIKK